MITSWLHDETIELLSLQDATHMLQLAAADKIRSRGDFMNIALGQVIKSLRQEKGITQEQLANHFGLTSQAISKWENGATYPDITLLPELAIFFGVSIDDLFSINNDDHLARIDNMLENEYLISPENFKYAERILNGMLAGQETQY